MARAIQTVTFTDKMVFDCLKDVFNLEEFRPQQLELIWAVLLGGDALGVMPTGYGKSLCFELAAVLMEGTTIVVSPLIALMRDQHAKNFLERGIKAVCFNSRLKGRPLLEAMAAIKGKNPPKIIYVSPERFRSRAFLQMIKKLPISLVAVDEAHCVKQWGFQFRPQYLAIAETVRKLGRPPVIALTATADVRTRNEIIRLLELSNPLVVYIGFHHFW